MKNIYIADLRSGDMLNDETFVISESRRAEDKKGSIYYDLVLTDKTGSMPGKIWSDNLALVDKANLKSGVVVRVAARVDEYRGQLQLNVSRVTRADEAKLEDYMQSSAFNPEDMFAELMEIINGFTNPDLQQLFASLFADTQVAAKFKTWPAAVAFHHEYRGGLLQHVLECLAMANASLERFYPQVNFELVRAGIILHDMGKLVELDASGFVPRYTVAGSVLGHIFLGAQLIEKHFPEGGDEKTKLHLQHIILSHHGEKEKGSPVLPLTAEAMLVSELDDASAKARQAADAMNAETDDRGMTIYNRHLQRWMWAGNKPGATASSDDASMPSQNDENSELVYSD